MIEGLVIVALVLVFGAIALQVAVIAVCAAWMAVSVPALALWKLAKRVRGRP